MIFKIHPIRHRTRFGFYSVEEIIKSQSWNIKTRK